MSIKNQSSILAFALAAQCLAAGAADAQDAYIPNFDGDSVSVLDTTANIVSATIPLGSFPEGVAITPDGKKVLFANRNSVGQGPLRAGSISILDRSTNIINSTIPVGLQPVGIAIAPDGKSAYVGNSGEAPGAAALWRIDIASGAVLDMINAGNNPFTVVLAPDGRQVYVTNGPANTISAVSTATNTLTATIPVGNNPGDLAITPDGSLIYVANINDNTVSVVTAATGLVAATINVGDSPFHIQVTPNGRQVYVGNQNDNTVSVIDTASQAVTATIPVGAHPSGINFTPDGSRAYIQNFDDSTVSVVDTASLSVVATIPVGHGPSGLGTFIAPALASPAAASLAAALLPGARSVELPAQATIFATLQNLTAMPLDNCQILLPGSGLGGASLVYQATDPSTNAPTGFPDMPATIPAMGAQSFVLTFADGMPDMVTQQNIIYQCDNVAQAAVVPGVNTVDLLFSATPVPDIVVLTATPSNDGVLDLSSAGAGAFAVASVNVGAAGTLTVSVNTGDASLPVAAFICQTNAVTGQCLAPPAASVVLDDPSGATPTFSVFVQSNGAIPFSPATSRIFVQFDDAGGLHGSSSVAIRGN